MTARKNDLHWAVACLVVAVFGYALLAWACGEIADLRGRVDALESPPPKEISAGERMMLEGLGIVGADDCAGPPKVGVGPCPPLEGNPPWIPCGDGELFFPTREEGLRHYLEHGDPECRECVDARDLEIERLEAGLKALREDD